MKKWNVLSKLNDEEVASSKKTYPIQDWSAKTISYLRPKWSKLIDTLFQTKTAKRTIPFGASHTYIAYIREVPPGAKNALQIMSIAAYASEINQCNEQITHLQSFISLYYHKNA